MSPMMQMRICFGAVLTVLAAQAQSEGTPASIPKNATLVYVGTRTDMQGKGIYVFRLQSQGTEVFQNVTLVPLGVAAETPNPTWLETDEKRRLLFAVNETDSFEGKPGGSVSAFSMDPAGKLTLVNQRSSIGTRPCRLALDKDGRHLLVASCGSGGVAVFPIADKGHLGEPTSTVKDGRSIALDPAGTHAFACDPASDKLLRYRFDAASGKLTPSEPAAMQLKAGSGPGQIVFRPDGRFAYVVSEKTSTISVYAYNQTDGTMRELETVSTVPEYFDGQNSAAGLAMHRSGKYLYVSNRGHNSVVLFTIDADKGTLAYVEEQGTGGKNPRHFGVEPSAKHMAIANMDSGTVLASRIDDTNGRLKPSGVFAEVPSPAFVEFVPPAEGKQ
jgi:6-phosphogluconolactonase